MDPDEHHFEATVAWTYSLGRMECAVSCRPATRAYGRVWALVCDTAPTRHQERAYFRARIAVPVSLAWMDVDDSDEEPVEHDLLGVAVDLSEGGMLCTGQATRPPVGRLVDATIRIEDDNLTQRARVVRHVGFSNGARGVALAFVEPSTHGDRIRRAVFETERRRRRVR